MTRVSFRIGGWIVYLSAGYQMYFGDSLNPVRTIACSVSWGKKNVGL